MFATIMGEKFFCGLDVGSQQLKASLVKVRRGHFELLGVYAAATLGLKKSSVRDLGDLTECIKLTVDGLAQKTGVKIKDLQLGIGGELIESRRSHAVIPLLESGNKAITRLDIKRVIQQARLLGIKLDEEVTHDFPQIFMVDGLNRTSNPTGIYGRKLEVDLLLLICHTLQTSSIIKAVNQAGYEVANLFFTSYASCEVSLNEKNKTDGCALIDIGAGATDVLIFKDGVLRCVENIPLGGEQATSHIANHLQLSFDLAEDIKKSYGMALSVEGEKDEEILVKNESGYFRIKREMIYQVIEPEITKLVSAIEQLIKGPLYDELKAGIIMVGGGSLLPGLIERIERNIKLPVSIGTMNIANTQLNNSAIFTAAVGLAQMGLTKTFAYTLSTRNPTNWFKNIPNRLRELYQEYF